MGLSSRQKNLKLEFFVIKTVAAFANSSGGILLIGVSDEGEFLGLVNDYRSLEGDKDKFERHLRQILGNNLSDSFVASNVKITFPTFDQAEICQVEVEKSSNPFFLKATEQGVKSEKFFIRNGNYTQHLSMNEFEDYWASRS